MIFWKEVPWQWGCVDDFYNKYKPFLIVHFSKFEELTVLPKSFFTAFFIFWQENQTLPHVFACLALMLDKQIYFKSSFRLLQGNHFGVFSLDNSVLLCVAKRKFLPCAISSLKHYDLPRSVATKLVIICTAAAVKHMLCKVSTRSHFQVYAREVTHERYPCNPGQDGFKVCPFT